MKFTSEQMKKAWNIRRAAAVKFNVKVSEISWKECLKMAVVNSIYTDGEYSITIVSTGSTHTMCTITNGTKSHDVPIRHAVEMPSNLIAALKKAGQKPQNFFCVKTLGMTPVAVRIAALQAWTQAVEADLLARAAKKEEERKFYEAHGKRALVLHDSYLMKASLVVVVEEEGELIAKGEWTDVNIRTAHGFLNGKKPNGSLRMESVVFFLSTEEIAILQAMIQEEKDEKAAAENAVKAEEVARIETARIEAVKTEKPVEFERHIVECGGGEECSHDLLIRMVRPDSSTFSTQHHCY